MQTPREVYPIPIREQVATAVPLQGNGNQGRRYLTAMGYKKGCAESLAKDK